MANRIFIYGLGHRPRRKKEIEKIAHLVLCFFDIKSRSLDITFLGDEEMKKLKRQHLKGKKGPANTLSIEAGEDFPKIGDMPQSLGEVLINKDLTQYQIEQVAPLLIHSMLHLLGYHHEKERDKIEMDRLTFDIKEALKRK